MKSEKTYTVNVTESELVFLQNFIDRVRAGEPAGEITRPETLTDWQRKLIDGAFLYPDGKRITNSLKATVFEYVTITEKPVTAKFIKENFLKDTGEKYTASTCESVATHVNNIPIPYKPGLNPD